jgi:hypothetical protein
MLDARFPAPVFTRVTFLREDKPGSRKQHKTGEKHGRDAHVTFKKHSPSIYRREFAQSMRKTGFRLQTSDIRKRDKALLERELREVKKKFKISIFIVIHMRAPCDVDTKGVKVLKSMTGVKVIFSEIFYFS